LVKIIYPADVKRVESEMNAALAGGKDYVCEYRFFRTDGEVRTLEARGHVIRDAGGRPQRMIGTSMDITERKQMEADLRQNVEELELFNKLAVGREIKMIQLKEEINELLGQLGQSEKYEIVK